MKKIISWGVMLAAAFTLTNCAKEIENPNEQPETAGVPFEIVASTVDTKTVNDGMSTKWAEGDQINLFHAVCDGTEYKNNGAFTVSDVEGGHFKGALCEALNVEEEYDWYAVYPYNAELTSPKNTTAAFTIATGLVQDGYDNMKHLAGDVLPLYGKAIAVPGADMPALEMSQIASVIAVKVTNNTADAIEVNEVSFVAAGNCLAGSYYFDFSDEKLTFKPAKPEYTATVSVENATSLAAGASATVYLAIMPFEAYEGDCLTLVINDEVTKEIYLKKDVDFTSGKIKTLNFSYETEEPAGPEKLTVAEFRAKFVGTTEYTLTGVMEGTYNTTYGNFYLNDGTAKVLVDGLTATKKTSNDKSFASLGLKDGDNVTIIGTRADYNGTAQVGGPAYLVSSQKITAWDAPAFSFVNNIITIVSNEGAEIYYTLDGSTPSESSQKYSEPIEIQETVTVSAIAVKEGRPNSPVAVKECEYVEISGDVVGGKADFNTISSTNTSYVTGKTTAGWNYKNCAIFKGGTSDSSPAFKMIGDATNRALCMNGKTSAVGSITSPTLKTGCGVLKFNYGLPFNDTKIKFRVDIMQGGAVVKTFTINKTSASKQIKYSHEEAINVAGDFQIVFTNLSPSNSGSNKDRTAIWDVEWTGFN